VPIGLAGTRQDSIVADGFNDPWFRPDHPAATALAAQASREIKPGHELYGLSLECTAKCAGCDDVVFRCSDDTFAVVHLTWSDGASPPWPTTTRCGSYMAIELVMDQHEH
jgi:hypothetical protein